VHTPAEIEAIVAGHGVAEYALDLDATMATVGPDPIWEVFPLGLRATTTATVRAFYALLFEHVIPRIESTEIRLQTFGEDSMMFDAVFRMREGDAVEDAVIMVALDVADGLVTSERMFFGGAAHRCLARADLAAFRAMPGVVDIGASVL
jgi:hypothetical protein